MDDLAPASAEDPSILTQDSAQPESAIMEESDSNPLTPPEIPSPTQPQPPPVVIAPVRGHTSPSPPMDLSFADFEISHQLLPSGPASIFYHSQFTIVTAISGPYQRDVTMTSIRHYNHFEWLRSQLEVECPACIVPFLPTKLPLQENVLNDEERTQLCRGLIRFLTQVKQHPVLRCSQSFWSFLSAHELQFEEISRQVATPTRPTMLQSLSSALSSLNLIGGISGFIGRSSANSAPTPTQTPPIGGSGGAERNPANSARISRPAQEIAVQTEAPQQQENFFLGEEETNKENIVDPASVVGENSDPSASNSAPTTTVSVDLLGQRASAPFERMTKFAEGITRDYARAEHALRRAAGARMAVSSSLVPMGQSLKYLSSADPLLTEAINETANKTFGMAMATEEWFIRELYSLGPALDNYSKMGIALQEMLKRRQDIQTTLSFAKEDLKRKQTKVPIEGNAKRGAALAEVQAAEQQVQKISEQLETANRDIFPEMARFQKVRATELRSAMIEFIQHQLKYTETQANLYKDALSVIENSMQMPPESLGVAAEEGPSTPLLASSIRRLEKPKDKM